MGAVLAPVWWQARPSVPVCVCGVARVCVCR